jgi:predicted RNase H-like nuclease
MSVIGVDGCRSGWFFVVAGSEPIRFGVVPSLDQLHAVHSGGDRIYVDIPIGLHASGPEPRACDVAARKMLGPARGASVFPPPVRGVLSQSTWRDALAASRALTGKGISRQVFGIIPKIRAVDALLRGQAAARERIREVHPEVCFCGLAGEPMEHNKKSREGFCERLDVLNAALPGSASLAEAALARYRRKEVARDDIADALVAAVTGMQPPACRRTLPDEPPLDACGLRMEMVYGLAAQGTGMSRSGCVGRARLQPTAPGART